jgi:predicted enzyme related to lactoylglutathione lyase
MSNSIVHFEIPADDVERAKKFYQEALGWKISDPWNMMYWLVETKEKGAEGINGGLMKRMHPSQPFMNYIAVDSIDEALKKVEAAGGEGGSAEERDRSGNGLDRSFHRYRGQCAGLSRVREDR